MQASPPTGYLEISMRSGCSRWATATSGSRASCTASITRRRPTQRRCCARAAVGKPGDARNHAGAAGGSTQRQWARLVQPRWAVTLNWPGTPICDRPSEADPPGGQHDGGRQGHRVTRLVPPVRCLLPLHQIDALHRTCADAELPGDRLDPMPAGAARGCGPRPRCPPWAGQPGAGSLGPGEAAVDPLDDDLAFELVNTPSI